MDGPVDADALRVDEFVPSGGTWGGLLFENLTRGIPRRLTWTFTFALGEVERPFGSTDVSLTVDWVHFPRCSWRAMPDLVAACTTYAEPIESSVYFFEHFRFDAVELRVVEQRDRRLRVTALVRGDVDALGVDEIRVDDWLDFDGIRISLDRPPRSIRKAEKILRPFTEVEGLKGSVHNRLVDFG